jgi:Protein of unknown function VcgC/VcgE (DUF2780)
VAALAYTLGLRRRKSMNAEVIRSQITAAAVCMIVLLAVAAAPAQTNPSPALVGQLTKQLSITPKQATGGAGALFGYAKSRLSAAEFRKVAAAVPGMSGLLRAAPSNSTSASTGGLAGLSGLAGSLPGQAGGLATVAGSFQKLGLSPGMIGKFVPVLTQFVQARGGTSTASLLGRALQ